jgi:hypothetical protein
MNLNDSNVINGKFLTRSEMNLLNTLVEKYGWKTFLDNEIATNPQNGVTCKVNRKEFLGDGQMTVNRIPVAVNFYDRVRYLILKLDREAYSNIID